MRNSNLLQNPMRLWALVMSVLFVALGILLLVKTSFMPNMPGEYRTIFAVLLLVYGIFRAARALIVNNRL